MNAIHNLREVVREEAVTGGEGEAPRDSGLLAIAAEKTSVERVDSLGALLTKRLLRSPVLKRQRRRSKKGRKTGKARRAGRAGRRVRGKRGNKQNKRGQGKRKTTDGKPRKENTTTTTRA
ncbi:uncharacterized protein LOC143278861 [Babylonia areolata]|uniref:uncharacterized protein LOC143278861 n=1 Tax=Babylonia areolata TaxID=304850 RepID=UPI003FD38B7B